jgi:hypothetical protein
MKVSFSYLYTLILIRTIRKNSVPPHQSPEPIIAIIFQWNTTRRQHTKLCKSYVTTSTCFMPLKCQQCKAQPLLACQVLLHFQQNIHYIAECDLFCQCQNACRNVRIVEAKMRDVCASPPYFWTYDSFAWYWVRKFHFNFLQPVLAKWQTHESTR